VKANVIVANASFQPMFLALFLITNSKLQIIVKIGDVDP
jgi:hypothetical protein